MEIIEFFKGYITKPLVIWAICLNILLKLTFIQEIFNFVEWILITQIYLVIFFTSFIFTYLQQMLPIQKSIKTIQKMRKEDKGLIPRIVSNRLGINIVLWFSAVLFFSGMYVSLGVLYDESVADKEKFNELRLTLLFAGFALTPIVSLFYFMDFKRIINKYNLKLSDDRNYDIIISIVSLTFFITLSYVAILNSNLHYF